MTRVMTLAVVCRDSGVSQAMVRQWIARDWLRPDPLEADDFAFQDIDLARLSLLVELHELQLGEAGVPVVLSLLDQLHDARRSLVALREALRDVPEPLRRLLAERLRADGAEPPPSGRS